MALITCPECGKEISNKSPSCIHCGCPLNNDQELHIEQITKDVEPPIPDKVKDRKKARKLGLGIVCVILAVIFIGILITVFLNNDRADSDISQTPPPTEYPTAIYSDITLNDIENWYESQIPEVCQALIEYVQPLGITKMYITDSKFLFGEDSGWYDCHYTIYFTCKVNGASCIGEARAFLEYADDTLTWFHLETFKESNSSTVLEYYADSYDQIIEDYYKNLVEEVSNSNSNNNSNNENIQLTPSAQEPTEEYESIPLHFTPFNDWIGNYTKVGFKGTKASSELYADSVLFSSDYIIDANSNRPWIEGADGNGIGETVTLYFDKEQTIDILALKLGYARSDEFYYYNNRPSILRFTFSDGNAVEYAFEDINRQNVIELSESVTTSYIEITILGVHDGTDNDTCIYLVEAYRK